MKKVKLTAKLSLNKETVAKLNNEQLNKVQGGTAADSCRCATTDCPHSSQCFTNVSCQASIDICDPTYACTTPDLAC